jgi:hypothetical protein
MNKTQYKSRCLLLNADYTPLRTIHWTKAIIWSLRYNQDTSFPIEIIKYYDNEFIFGTNNKKFLLPCIAKTVNYYSIYDRKITFSRKNLFIRDDYTCQYCGQHFNTNQLTYDHIIPKSRFKEKDKHKSTNWTNIVTACRSCNHQKGNRTPNEANMELIKQPARPSYSFKYLPLYNDESIIRNNEICEHWKEFIA